MLSPYGCRLRQYFRLTCILLHATWLPAILNGQVVELTVVRPYDLVNVIGRDDVQVSQDMPDKMVDSSLGHRNAWLDLSHRGLEEVPEEVWGMYQLEALNLGGNPIAAISPDIVHLKRNLKILIVSGTKITELPPELAELTSLTVLEADDAMLTAFPVPVTKLLNLHVLSLARNAIESADVEWPGQSCLQEIDLSGNRLSNFPSGLLSLSKLEVLRLSENDIMNLPRELGELETLRLLDISYNPIYELPVGVFPPSLRLLLAYGWHVPDMSDSDEAVVERLSDQGAFRQEQWADEHITTLPDDFELEYPFMTLTGPPAEKMLKNCPESVVSLALSGATNPQVLSSLSELRHLRLFRTIRLASWDMEQFRHLRALTLRQVQPAGEHEHLLEEIDALQRLVHLEVSECEIVTLPQEIGRLSALRYLDVSVTGLRHLPAEVTELRRLVWLKASVGDLAQLPEAIGELDRLTWLELRQNALTSLPVSVGKLSRLTELNLESNALTSLPSSIGGWTSLDTLYLSENDLTVLPEEFTSLTNLRVCSLRDNKISRLPEQISSLTFLEVLDLSDNPLPPQERERLRKALPDTELLFSDE